MERLRGREGIITLFNVDIDIENGVILMILECGEKDLNGVLQEEEAKLSGKSANLDENFTISSRTYLVMIPEIKFI